MARLLMNRHRARRRVGDLVAICESRDGSDMFEVVRFHSPSVAAQEPVPAANHPGLRHIALTVDDLRGVVDRIREAGWV